MTQARTATPLWPGLPLAIAGAVAFSGKSVLIKLAYGYGVDATALFALRQIEDILRRNAVDGGKEECAAAAAQGLRGGKVIRQIVTFD